MARGLTKRKRMTIWRGRLDGHHLPPPPRPAKFRFPTFTLSLGGPHVPEGSTRTASLPW